MTSSKRTAAIRSWMLPLLALAMFWAWQLYSQRQPPPKKVPYSELLADLDANRVENVDVRADAILASIKSEAKAGGKTTSERVVAVRLPGIDATSLVAEMHAKGVVFKGESDEAPWWQQLLLSWIFPVGLLLAIHTRQLKLDGDVDLQLVAQRTPGMVGADLANAANEAALAAARRSSQVVARRDFEEAIDRLQLGLAKRGRTMNDQEKRRVAYHESGHTLVALSVEHSDPVHRVTIIPRSIGALGETLQLPTEDRYLMRQAELRDRICVMLGGRAAEQIVFGDRSTGAQNDLERASETARQMVCRFGMSDELGPQTFGRAAGARFLEMPVSLGEERNFSEATAQTIDREVAKLLNEERDRAYAILEKRRPMLERIAQHLSERETLERAELDQLIEASG